MRTLYSFTFIGRAERKRKFFTEHFRGLAFSHLMKLIKYWIKTGFVVIGALYVGQELGLSACGELLSWIVGEIREVCGRVA